MCEALGYDKSSDPTAEFAIRGGFADSGLRVDKQLVALGFRAVASASNAC